MRIYRFRVLIDHPGEAFRDIEIGSEQTFLDLHKAIKEAFGFQGREMACFYVSDEEWGKGPEIPLADLGFAEDGEVPPLMEQVLISDHIRGTQQRFIYAYDFLHLWMFMVELVHAGAPGIGAQYPRVAMSMGTAPDEHSKAEDLHAGIIEEDPYAAGPEEHRYDEDDESDEDDGPDGDEDGGPGRHGSIDDLGEEYR